MFTPSLEEFRRLAAGGNLIPVYREHLADMETPVSVVSRFADDEYVFLLESVEGGERWGRFSFIGLHPYAVFSVEDGVPRLFSPAHVELLEPAPTPLAALRAVLARRRPVEVPGLPRFFAGAVGTISYETVHEFERLPAPKGEGDEPTASMMLTDELIVFDNIRNTMKIVCGAHLDAHESPEAAYRDACRRIGIIERRLRETPPAAAAPKCEPPPAMESNLARADFEAMVRRAQEYIGAGDIIQTVLSQRFSTPFNAAPLAVYRALRLINPSPYMFLLKFGGRVLAGSSPEVMVRLTGRRAELRPIAGTRPRGTTEQADRELADSLLADEKERAEHVMLVDLGRNDLGRVAVAGSVQVRDFMTIERYSHVMHIVSHVQAELQPDKDAFDLIRATFPAGTLSGAPKIRAMEIINELEPGRRGAYGGAVGYIGCDGNMDLAITIRTVELAEGTAAVQAGAGIVYDSKPDCEYDETISKAKGMCRALELAAAGLELGRVGPGGAI